MKRDDVKEYIYEVISNSMILITIFVIMILGVSPTTLVSSAAAQDAKKSSETNSLTRSKLVELRKTTLLQEIQSYQPGATSRFLHKWELRLLLLALTASYLAFRVKGELTVLRFNKRGLYIAAAVILLSMLYDAHLASLDATVNRRRTLLYEELYRLPSLDREKLLALKPVASIEELRGNLYKRWCLRFKKLLNLDSVLFYSVVVAIWTVGYAGLKGTSES
ncbi:hypothetical protein IH879_00640 [candidate division KSB1 bacterium]|nr:hypothetical protein [candidate division KSB1 bacterium]